MASISSIFVCNVVLVYKNVKPTLQEILFSFENNLSNNTFKKTGLGSEAGIEPKGEKKS